MLDVPYHEVQESVEEPIVLLLITTPIRRLEVKRRFPRLEIRHVK